MFIKPPIKRLKSLPLPEVTVDCWYGEKHSQTLLGGWARAFNANDSNASPLLTMIGGISWGSLTTFLDPRENSALETTGLSFYCSLYGRSGSGRVADELRKYTRLQSWQQTGCSTE